MNKLEVISMTKIVNLKTDKFDIKITRNYSGKIPDYPEFGWAGNPFKVEDHGREKCIELYKEYFYKRIMEDENFKNGILSLKGKTLACFCKPLPCHGDVIKEYLDGNV